jgi:ankyrin repeat protein
MDLQDIGGCTPLYTAAQQGHAAITKQLIDARCNVDLQNQAGATPLLLAAGLGPKANAAITEQLIAARCNVDLQHKDGFTALHGAAYEGHAAVTKQLLAVRCNVDVKDANGRTAPEAAEHQGHTAIATLIRSKKQEIPLLRRRVLTHGLVAKPELNGRTGTAVSFDDDTGRYSVELDETSSSFMIKPCNLSSMVCAVCSSVPVQLLCHFFIHYQNFLHVYNLLQASPEQTKEQQEDAGGAMKEEHQIILFFWRKRKIAYILYYIYIYNILCMHM